MPEEDKKEAAASEKASEASEAASTSSIKTEAMEAEDAGGDKSKSEASGSSKETASASTSSSSASEGKIKAEAKSVLSGEAGDGEMDEAAMRRALQVSKFLEFPLGIRRKFKIRESLFTFILLSAEPISF